MVGRGRQGTGRERVLAALAGKIMERPVRGELWPLSGGGTAGEVIGVAKEVGADFCFFDQAPGAVGKAHALGLAAGGVINGPWQRWMIDVGWEKAMMALARDTDDLQQGLRVAAGACEKELAEWTASGADAVLLADDIAYAGGPYMSPGQVEKYLLPLYRSLSLQAAGFGVSLGFHTDGCVDLLLPILRQADFRFYSLEPEGTDPLRAWSLIGRQVPLFSGLPAEWLMPGGFLPSQEGALLRQWLEAGPLVLCSACGLYHADAKKALKEIYRWMDTENILAQDEK